MITLVTTLVLLASPSQPPQELKAKSTEEHIPNSMMPAEPPPPPKGVSMVNREEEELARKRLPPTIWVPATAGGVMVATGLTFYFLARVQEQHLVDGDLNITTDAQVQETVKRGKTYETIGLSLTGVGAAALVYSCVLFYGNLVPRHGEPQVSLAPIQGGAVFALQGTF